MWLYFQWFDGQDMDRSGLASLCRTTHLCSDVSFTQDLYTCLSLYIFILSLHCVRVLSHLARFTCSSPGYLKSANLAKIPITRSWYPTIDRSWIVDFWNLPVKWVFVSLPFGFLLTLLFVSPSVINNLTGAFILPLYHILQNSIYTFKYRIKYPTDVSLFLFAWLRFLLR